MITDPHIHASSEYFVYNEGLAMQDAIQPAHNVTNIFVREPNAVDNYVGACWPGPAVWIDYLNNNAASFWGQLYNHNNWQGSNYLYGAWIDMNEPSIFLNETDWSQIGMPMNNTHIQTDGTVVQHRWVHNAYGALQMRATWNGLYNRDNGTRRPFVLTRSTFIGAQKYGAMWTGDSMVSYDDISLFSQNALTLGISGMIFLGSDLPGFNGFPTDEQFI